MYNLYMWINICIYIFYSHMYTYVYVCVFYKLTH